MRKFLMASLLVDSQLLDKRKTQHIIGVADSQLYLAADVPSKFVFSEVTHGPVEQRKGQLRVLKRTFCSAEELQVLVSIPFEVDSRCSPGCMDMTSSLAIYHLAGQYIYAFASGYFGDEWRISESIFRISLLTGQYIRFKCVSLDGDVYSGCGWQACSHCRGSQLRLLEGERMLLHDTLVVAKRVNGVFCNQPTQAIELTLSEKENSFKMYSREWRYPGLQCFNTNLPLLPINKKCNLWACLTTDHQLVLCNTRIWGNCAMLVGTPDKHTRSLLNSFANHSLRVNPNQYNRLQLIVEPENAALSPFLFFDFGFAKEERLFNLTFVGKSSVLTPPGSLVLSHPNSQVYVEQGVLYKFYGNACFTSFLRTPSLAEIAFVALQKDCAHRNTANGALIDGIGPEELNEQLGVCAQWL